MLEKIILRNKKNDSWRIFSSPKEVLYSKNLHEVKTILDKVESKINEKEEKRSEIENEKDCVRSNWIGT